MNDGNEHIAKLVAARERLVGQRRHLADSLVEPYEGGHTENMQENFRNVQAAVEVIDKAIEDETKIAARARRPPPAPPTPGTSYNFNDLDEV